MKEFGYTSVMQCPKLEKIVINQGMGQAVADKKLIDVAQAEAEDLGDLVDVDLREDDLLGDAEGVVALAVELLVDTLEVANAGAKKNN